MWKIIKKNIKIIPILLIVLITPLILKLFPYNLSIAEQSIYGYKLHSDIFNIGKSNFFLAIVLITSIFIIVRNFKDKDNFSFTNLMFLPYLYGFFVLISAIFSEHKDIVWWGSFESFEGAFIQIGYILLIWIIINCVNLKKDYWLIMDCISIGVIIMGIVSISQYAGYNIINWYPIRVLISNFEIAENASILAFNSKQVYGTLPNPNYIGSYTALLIPTYLYLSFLNKKRTTLYEVCVVISVFMLMSSQSDAGLLGTFIGVSLVISLLSVDIIKSKEALHNIIKILVFSLPIILYFMFENGFSKERFLILVISTVFFAGFNIIRFSLKLNGYKKWVLFCIILVSFMTLIFTGFEFIETLKEEEFIQILEADKNQLKVKTLEDEFKLNIVDDKIKVFDFDGNIVRYVIENNQIISENLALRRLEILYDFNGNTHNFYMKRIGINFTYEKEGFIFKNNNGRKIHLKEVERTGFKGLGQLFSCRGYIWSTSLPLLEKYLAVGNGADTFVLVFPQEDIVGKFNMFGSPYWIINKPHSKYLQIAIQSGLISLGIYILIIGQVIFYEYKRSTNTLRVELGLICGVIGYSTTVIFNDSSIGVTIFFWTFIGLLYNSLYKENMK